MLISKHIFAHFSQYFANHTYYLDFQGCNRCWEISFTTKKIKLSSNRMISRVISNSFFIRKKKVFSCRVTCSAILLKPFIDWAYFLQYGQPKVRNHRLIENTIIGNIAVIEMLSYGFSCLLSRLIISIVRLSKRMKHILHRSRISVI